MTKDTTRATMARVTTKRRPAGGWVWPLLCALALQAAASLFGCQAGAARPSPPLPSARLGQPSASRTSSGGPAHPALAWPYTPGESPRSADGMVVTDAAQASRVGARILSMGGNAVDAAVASAFALAVVFPTAGNIGGGGFLVAHMGGESYALDFRETAPFGASRDMYIGPDGQPTGDSRDGWKSAGVPGSVAGLWEAWHTLGSKRLTWKDLLSPAIALADRGFVVDTAFSKTIGLVAARLARFPASAALFLPDGSPPAEGSTWRDPDLGNVLRRIAEEGPPGFYGGPVADAIARAEAEGGGLITSADLKAYRAKWRRPIVYTYRGRTVIGMPPPSSGGMTMAMVANILSAWDIHALGWHSAAQIHLTAEALRRAFAARNARLGDPDFVRNPESELLSDGWAANQRATMRLDRATSTRDLFPNAAADADGGPHTTHLSVVDADGNAAALTTTLNNWYGSAATVPGMGFVLNDEMDDFASVPGAPNMFGLVQGEANAVAAGKRMLSSMSPTIVFDPNGKIELVLGAAGGSRIISAVFQELSNALDFGMDAAEAVDAPRFHQQDWPDTLFLEARGFPDDVRLALDAMGHATEAVDHIADAPAIGRVAGAWLGAAEPRRQGSLAAAPSP